MIYASIDLETTGTDPQLDQILEVGIVIDDLDANINTNPPTFHAYIRHHRLTGNPTALAMNADIIKIIGENRHQDIFTPQDAGHAIDHFLRKYCGDKATAAGKNFQAFDRPFLLREWPFLSLHHRALDPTTNFYQRGDKTLPDLTMCLKRAKIELPLKLHSAIDDAKAVIQLIRKIHP